MSRAQVKLYLAGLADAPRVCEQQLTTAKKESPGQEEALLSQIISGSCEHIRFPEAIQGCCCNHGQAARAD